MSEKTLIDLSGYKLIGTILWYYDMHSKSPSYEELNLCEWSEYVDTGLSIHEVDRDFCLGSSQAVDLIFNEWKNIGMPHPPKVGDGIFMPWLSWFRHGILIDKKFQHSSKGCIFTNTANCDIQWLNYG